MGHWTLEIAKMALYVTFPVALFHYFNQPQYFEEWVVNTKREMYPPEDPVQKEKFFNAIRAVQEKQRNEYVASLERE
ncbi:protein PET100 homolog, mitochondrial [Leptinotarsa decemlineata]|uniref:protein PET100 homolog, mitochondrial n=1 Tax=Leptinotarsa decemlineata TaxID=7539 RepID=UPI003D308127